MGLSCEFTQTNPFDSSTRGSWFSAEVSLSTLIDLKVSTFSHFTPNFTPIFRCPWPFHRSDFCLLGNRIACRQKRGRDSYMVVAVAPPGRLTNCNQTNWMGKTERREGWKKKQIFCRDGIKVDDEKSCGSRFRLGEMASLD